MKKILTVLMTVLLALSVSTVFAAEEYNVQNDVSVQSVVERNVNAGDKVSVNHFYEVWCYKADGTLRWYDTINNHVPDVGLQAYLSQTLQGGTQDTTYFVGLVTGPGSGTTYAYTDTMASHAGWTEDNTSYTGNRPAYTEGSSSCSGSEGTRICSVSNSASKASYTIDSTCSAGCTVAGAFLVTDDTGTAGTLMGAGDFTGGDRTVYENDTLNVQVTAQIGQ